MKTIYLVFVLQFFCLVNLTAQKVPFSYRVDPIHDSIFKKQWVNYQNSDPKIPLLFQNGEGKECSFDGYGLNGIPEFLCTCNNLDAARTIGTQQLWSGGSLGLNLSGVGLNKLALWDGGSARTTHIEYSGRITVIDTPSAVSGHTTAVVGNLIASGINSNVKGMSYQTQLRNWNFTNDNAEIIGAGPDLFLSNHSYASTTAWQYIGSNLYWYGDSTINMYRDWKFGYYDNRSRIWDSVMVQNPYYLMVKAAGNDRGSGVAPGTTHYYWNGTAWALSNTTRDTVGPYDCVSTFGCGKNLLTIGAIQVMPNGYQGPSSIGMLSFSSWGPTDDGRIKPDLVAASGSILSTGTANDSSYASLGGTSIAAPNVTGSLLLLQQYFNQLKGRYMRNATLKALAIHTANRCKNNPGPDYECGWGLPNMPKSIQCIQDSFHNTILEQQLNNNDSFLTDVYVSSGDTLRITLAWTDPKGITSAPAFNDTTRKLVNDLDLRLYNLSGNVIGLPFILNPANPSAAASTGDNNRDNIEQIYATSLNTGRYRVKVKHKGTLSTGSQTFSMIIGGSPLYSVTTPVKWLSLSANAQNWDEVRINWALAQEVNNKEFIIEYSLDNALFNEAGRVPGAGNLGTISKYEFNHVLKGGLPEIIYYRIKQTDWDGKIAYSKTIHVHSDNNWRIVEVYPNPFSQILSIQLDSKSLSTNTVYLFDMLGQLMFEKEFLYTGNHSQTIDLSYLNRGSYILKIVEKERGYSYLRKVVKF